MTINHAPYASQAIVNSAISAGITAEVIANSRGSHRRHHANGSTAVPQKVVLLKLGSISRRDSMSNGKLGTTLTTLRLLV